VGHGRLVAAPRVRGGCSPRPDHAGCEGMFACVANKLCGVMGGVGGAWQAGNSSSGVSSQQPEA
jgi:hypothetical protein